MPTGVADLYAVVILVVARAVSVLG